MTETNVNKAVEVSRQSGEGMVSTLYSHRKIVTGNLRVLILFFIYIQILWMNSMNGGKTILVLDSNDQPHEWWKIPLTEFLPPDGHSGHQIESFDANDQAPAG